MSDAISLSQNAPPQTVALPDAMPPAPADALDVGGFVPMSTVDWPDRLAAVVFVQGCPWRCHYCHNPGLQPRCAHPAHGWARVLETLQARQGLLDGVVFSGGEPTLDRALIPAIRQVRVMGFEVGLHTAGLYPERLAECLPLVDWVALDVKTDFDDYKAITAVPRSGDPVRACLDLVLASGKPHELRTTWHPDLISDTMLMRLARRLKAAGARRWVLQSYRATPSTEASLGTGVRTPPDELVDRLRRTGLDLMVR